jgi:hypothetical protein
VPQVNTIVFTTTIISVVASCTHALLRASGVPFETKRQIGILLVYAAGAVLMAALIAHEKGIYVWLPLARSPAIKRPAGPTRAPPDPGRPELLPRGAVENAMPEKALDQPVHLNIHPDEPVRSLDAAAKIIRRHTAGRIDEKAQAVLRAIAEATSPHGVAAASGAFRRMVRTAR